MGKPHRNSSGPAHGTSAPKSNFSQKNCLSDEELEPEDLIRLVRAPILQLLEKSLPYLTFLWMLVSKVATVATHVSLCILEYNVASVKSIGRTGNMMFYLMFCCCSFCVGSLTGWFLFTLATIFCSALGVFFNFSIGLLSFLVFSFLATLIYGSTMRTILLVAVSGGMYAFQLTKALSVVLCIYSIVCCFLTGGFRALILSWALSCAGTNLVLHRTVLKSTKPDFGRQSTRNPNFRQPKRDAGRDPQGSREGFPSPQGSGPGGKGAEDFRGDGREKPRAFFDSQTSPASYWSTFVGGSNREGEGSGSQEEGGKPNDRGTAGESKGGQNGTAGASFQATGKGESTTGGAATEPSTSGREDADVAPDAEVARILSCGDHYSVLGFEKLSSLDPLVLKKEYRKKAVLVHPDKHGGSERASDAFKRLQSAYEVLQDEKSLAEYDAALRQECFLEQLRERVNKAKEEDGIPPGARKVNCLTCGQSHLWCLVDRSQERARWCQDCREFHSAKEGDGWMEQDSQKVFFGLIPALGPKRAYTLVNKKVFDITEWVECQGLECPPNTHKPTFVSKTGHCSGGGSNFPPSEGLQMPPNAEDMTEEEVMEFLAQGIASGMFDAEDLQRAMRGEGGQEPGGFGREGGSQGKKSGGKKKKKSRRTQF